MIDELVSFRIKVRNFALATPDTEESPSAQSADLLEVKQQQKEERRQRLQERMPLLLACDRLRQDLAIYGINIKVCLCIVQTLTIFILLTVGKPRNKAPAVLFLHTENK